MNKEANMRGLKACCLLACVVTTAVASADVCKVTMHPGEHWWGVCNNFGREMPFTEKSDFSCDLRLDNYSHQSLSFLCSDKGRVVWCAEQLDRLVKDYGVDGFKFDGGGVEFYSAIRGGHLAHDASVSPAVQSAHYGKFALKYRGSEYRNGFGFAGKSVIMRLHDKAHKWDEFRRIVPDMLAAGFVGCPFICPDMIGGGSWTTFLPGAPFDPELFIRSAQVHALCPMMQISASPWRVLSPEHQRIFRDVVALRRKFAPRFVGLAKESARTGEPMMRNLEYCFPGMGYADIKDEFMMGQDLLVAPVIEKGATSRRVVIPPGRWCGDDGKTVEGPAAIEVAAPLERLPYFIRMSGEVLRSRCSTEKRDSVKGAS